MNFSLADSFNSLTKVTSFEVRAGYLALCFRLPRSDWTGSDDSLTLTKQLHPEQDPINLIGQMADFKNANVFYRLI